MKIKSANKIYFGKNYENNLTEQLYSFDRSKLLAEKKILGFGKIDLISIKKYFSCLV